jgi:hypothetical protein
MRLNRTGIITLGVLVAASSFPLLVRAQKSAPAELAQKLTGSWKVNRELSPSLGRGRGGQEAAALAVPRIVLASFQRGGGRSGAGADASSPQDLTPDQIAARNAVRQLQQVPDTLKIVATPEQITFTEARGVSSFPINNKGVKIDVGDAKVEVKTKWDKATVRQEFNAYQQKLTKMWSVDENGRLVLNVLVESMNVNTNSGVPSWTQQTATAVFDKQ